MTAAPQTTPNSVQPIFGIDAAQSAERQGSVAAGDEQVDGTMVQHPQHLLAQHQGAQAVVDTGDRVEQDHGCAEDRARDHAHGVMPRAAATTQSTVATMPNATPVAWEAILKISSPRV